MSPLPIDPILPVGTGGDVRVSPSGSVDRVTRRFARDGDQDGGGSRHHHHHEPGQDRTWGSSAHDPALEAGAYDDHGRIGAPPPGGVASLRHVDVSA